MYICISTLYSCLSFLVVWFFCIPFSCYFIFYSLSIIHMNASSMHTYTLFVLMYIYHSFIHILHVESSIRIQACSLFFLHFVYVICSYFSSLIRVFCAHECLIYFHVSIKDAYLWAFLCSASFTLAYRNVDLAYTVAQHNYVTVLLCFHFEIAQQCVL